MSDAFEHHGESLQSPASAGFAIVPDDDAALAVTTRAIYVGLGGRLSVEMKAGGTVSFENLPDGALLPIRAVRVLETTTAAALVGLA